MFGFGQLIDILKKNPKKIVFTEGSDPRILEASSRLLASNFLHPILVGDEAEIEAAARRAASTSVVQRLSIQRLLIVWKRWLSCSVNFVKAKV